MPEKIWKLTMIGKRHYFLIYKPFLMQPDENTKSV